MVCIYCGADTHVINSRLQKRVNQVWRRRSCQVCHNTFTTHEKADTSTAVAVRYSAKDVRPFSRDALFISLYESCKHRPDAVADAEGLTQTVITKLFSQLTDGAISRQEIVTNAAQVLGRFDATAAAVYQAFHPASPTS